MNESGLSREAEALGVISFLNGFAFESIREVTGKTVFSWIGSGQSTFWSFLSSSWDDGVVSFKEATDIFSGLVGGSAGARAGKAITSVAPYILGGPIGVGGRLALYGAGTLAGPYLKNALFNFSDLDAGTTDTLLDDAGFGRVDSTGAFRVDPYLPAATSIRVTRQAISEGYKVPFALEGAARDYPSNWSFPAVGVSAAGAGGGLADPFAWMPFSKPSMPLGFGNVRGSTAAPPLGEHLSFPAGSPDYPASAAQRMKTLQ